MDVRKFNDLDFDEQFETIGFSYDEMCENKIHFGPDTCYFAIIQRKPLNIQEGFQLEMHYAFHAKCRDFVPVQIEAVEVTLLKWNIWTSDATLLNDQFYYYGDALVEHIKGKSAIEKEFEQYIHGNAKSEKIERKFSQGAIADQIVFSQAIFESFNRRTKRFWFN